MNRALMALAFLFLSVPALEAGAACCAAKGAFPSLITDHSQTQFSLSITGSTVIGTSNQNGNSAFYHSDKFDRSLALSGSAAAKLSERFQLGASFPYVMKSSRDLNRKASAQGVGDPSLSLGYEIIDHHYGSLPQSFFALTMGIPVADSAEDSQLLIADAAIGSGHWTLQGAWISLKNWADWTASVQALAQYSFPQTIESSAQKIKISPGWSLDGNLRGGLNFWNQKIYVGLGLGPKWQQAQTRRDIFGESKRGYRLAWNTSAEANLSLREALSMALSYTDQTLLGPTRRSSLSRSLALSFQLRQ